MVSKSNTSTVQSIKFIENRALIYYTKFSPLPIYPKFLGKGCGKPHFFQKGVFPQKKIKK